MKRTDFLYHLPEKRIAKHPVNPRHNSKLIQYFQGKISHHSFKDISNLLPEGCQVILNNAKVIPARILCNKTTGSAIEIFLLEPILDYESTFSMKSSCQWNVLVGNKKRWKEGHVYSTSKKISASWINREQNIIQIDWTNNQPFSEVIATEGVIPIPPYLNRDSTKKDQDDYQTLYAKIAGSVAAPTAGLHFTNEVISAMKIRNIKFSETTLHVGAGTFKPVAVDEIENHHMHAEQFEVRLDFIQSLINHSGLRIAIGTTSLRVLESLYIIGNKLALGMENPFIIDQMDSLKSVMSYTQSLEYIKTYLEVNGNQMASTQIFIYPGIKIHSIEGLITNFHQPSSSLIMLIAACIGEEWKRVYEEALNKQYRFLSYGDSSLLWVNH